MCGGNPSGQYPSPGMQKGMGQPTDYSNLGGSLGNATYGSAFHPGSSVFSDTILPQTGGSDFSAPTYPGYSNPSWLGSYGPDQHQPYGAGQQRSGGQILNSDGSLYQPPGNIPFTTNPDGTINFGGSQSPPPTGGAMNVQQPPPPQMQNGGMPSWLSQFMQSMPQQQQAQQQAQPQPQAPPPPLQSSDANVQAYLNQNYMPGIHGGPDPSMLAGSMNQQPSMNKVAQVQQPPNPFARGVGPDGTINGPGGLGFTPPGQPTQLFGPTAGLFGGVTRPQGTPNNFGYFPGSGQWGAPNMGWASQWGKQPG